MCIFTDTDPAPNFIAGPLVCTGEANDVVGTLGELARLLAADLTF